MDELLTLGAIVILLIVVGMPYLLISHSRLKSRVTWLEAQIFDLKARRLSTAKRPVKETTDSGPWKTARAASNPESESVAEPALKTPSDTPPVSPPTPRDTRPHAMAASVQAGGETQSQTPPRAFVFNADKMTALSAWMRENWVLAVAAASLVFAGVFMVQYGVEHGLLTPFWRVIAALGFGAALIAGGEWIRRHHGDGTEDGDGATAFLPSTLSGAGLIVLFAGVLSARVLYDLIEPGTALAGLCTVAVLAIVLGWFYGPVLAAVGIVGATAAPFLVGGDSEAPWIFYYYFLLIALAGLAVDTIRRWAWVSALTLIITLGAMALLYLGDAGTLHFLMAVLITTAAAIAIPVRALVPGHSGAAISEFLIEKRVVRSLPDFPTRIALGVILVASIAAGVVIADAGTPDQVWLGLGALMVLLAATLIWMARAPALYDLALIPGAAFLAMLMNEASAYGALYSQFRSPLRHNDPELPLPETAWIVYTLATLGVVVTVLAFWRMRASLRDAEAERAPVIWAMAASVFAPATVLILEFLWLPADVLGDMPWALTVIAVAAVMTLLAERSAHAPDTARLKLRIGLFAIAALTLISLAIFLLLTKSALTLALGVMVLLTALLDRKFDLPILGWFLQLGVAVISYRLIVDPGMYWAIEWASFVQVLLAYIGAMALLIAAWTVLRASASNPGRGNSQVIVESALWTIGAVFVCILLFRLFENADFESHWGAGLLGTVWLVSAVNQTYRLGIPGMRLRGLRGVLAVVFGLVALGFLALQSSVFNPLFSRTEMVLGPPILDSLAVAYLPVALVFAVAAWKLNSLRQTSRNLLTALSALFGVAYVGLEIRRLWRGPDLSVRGVTDAELYSYTVAMLLGAVLLLMLAFSRRSDVLRKLAMAGVALTIAKVFLIDMSGLSGLTRVFSFMGLGLGLVALAWLNRKMTEQWDRTDPGDPPDGSPKTGEHATTTASVEVTAPEAESDK